MESQEQSPSETSQNGEQPTQPLPVVGIGASAGGLAALKSFFGRMPPDSGLAFVVVVHLAPEHDSHLADLLQPHTSMPVRQVTETVALEPNQVYVIPPGRNLNTIDTHLRLSALEARRRERAPIDHFFRTLSETHHEEAIGIVLTGTGSDGAVGLKMIKEQGGLTIVQDPNEAEYDGMPQSAIATGLVDFVLPIAAMPACILRFAQTKPRVPVPEDDRDLSDEAHHLLQKIFAQVRTRTGHDFSRYKRSTIMRRIRRRMQIHQIEQLDAYLDMLRESRDEVKLLFDDLLITITNFFRDAEIFERLEQTIIPHLFEGKTPEDHVRVWSVGCATGEEAYSLAILLLEQAARRKHPPKVQVFASDLHEHSLKKAREGIFPETIEADVSPERLQRFFTKDNGTYRIHGEVRDVVIFAPHDLLKDPPFSHLDLITCRNVLIYLQRDVQQDVIELFHYALNADGYLLLGTSETVDRTDLFRCESQRHCLYRRRNVPAPELRLPVFPLPSSLLSADEQATHRAERAIKYGALHEMMVEQYAPPSILLNDDYNIVHYSAHAGRYLIHPGGEPTSNVFKLVREALRIELRAALYAAKEKGESSHSKPIPLQVDGEQRQVVVRVRPAPRDEMSGFMLVIFDEIEASGHAVESSAAPTDGSVRELEAELDLTRQRLQAIIEEYETSQEDMRASNEELQSANEELRSALEELETSKEELQSMNEELQTVNQENRHKVEELSQLSSDLQNLLAATDIATLFLDRQLRILRFTPRVGELFNIRYSDRGRPLADLTHRLGYDALHADAQRVLDKLVPIEREIQSEDNQWYLTRVLPYRTAEDYIEGVVITFVDITERKRADEALRENEKRLQRTLEIDTVGIIFWDATFRIRDVNDGFLSMTGFDRKDALGLTWQELTPEAFHPVSERAVAELEEMDEITPYEKQYYRKDGSYWWGLFAARRLNEEEVAEFVLDITEQKQAEEALKELNETLEKRVEERTRQVQSLASTLTMAEQEERRRISQILHDDLQQRLYGVQLKLNLIHQDVDAGNREALQANLEEAQAWLESSIDVTRKLTVDLSPPILKDEGLTDALGWLVTQLETMHDLKVNLEADHAFVIADEDMRVLLFQIVRELLFNVVKHAGVQQVTVALREVNDHLVIRVEDSGRGFDVEAAASKAGQHEGLGLFSIRERLRLFGGRMEITSHPGEGTEVTIHTPAV